MAVELIDEWGDRKRVPPATATRGPVLPPVSTKDIRERLEAFDPPILNVHCFEDVGYPWVQVVFDRVIHPDVAIRVADELAAVVGEDCVYLNSLRPSAIYFVLEPAFEPKPDLEASRYGALLSDIKESWAPPYEGTRSRSARSRRGGPSRRATGP